jgi:hypothetical protein
MTSFSGTDSLYESDTNCGTKNANINLFTSFSGRKVHNDVDYISSETVEIMMTDDVLFSSPKILINCRDIEDEIDIVYQRKGSSPERDV